MKILVTGGGTGIGKAIAKTLKQKGDEVIIVGRRADVLERTAKELGVEYLSFDCVHDNPSKIFESISGINGLVNNAGTVKGTPIGEWTAKDWQDQLDVHVIAVAMMSQAFVKNIKGPGAIVNMASNLVHYHLKGYAAYGAAKAAMVHLTKSMAQELAKKDIRVNAVLPGVIPTDMTLPFDDQEKNAKLLESYKRMHPLGKLGSPENIGEVVTFLMHAEWVSGAEIVVDGGFLTKGNA